MASASASASPSIIKSKYFKTRANCHSDHEYDDDDTHDTHDADADEKEWTRATTTHESLTSAVRAAEGALEEYLRVAKRKNAHAAHARAAHEVLRHFRTFLRDATTIPMDGHAQEREREEEEKEEEEKTMMRDGGRRRRRASWDAWDGFRRNVRTYREVGASGYEDEYEEEEDKEEEEEEIKREKKEEDADADDGVTIKGCVGSAEDRAQAGYVLQNMLQETRRLHVNASCRVRTRAPEVKKARDGLTAIRREARDMFRTIDPEGFRMDQERVRMSARETQAALDAEMTRFETPPKDLAELRAKCPVMASTGSPHHLCAHLCYYREYEPTRQMYVLRCRAAEANGTASALDGWRAELAVRPAEDIPAVNRSRADPRGTASGACSLKHLPWIVEFVGPNGERTKEAIEVLQAVNVECDALSWPRASHGGNGVREARVCEDGLSDQTELLRAALWTEATDAIAGTTPVRQRVARNASADAPARTPLRLAPDPLAARGADNAADADRAETNGGIVLAAATHPVDASGTCALSISMTSHDPDPEHDPERDGPHPIRHWWSPPLSPFGLLEEILWQDEWKLLVACMMLNCTTRLQVDRVLWRLFLLAPTAADAVRLGETHEGQSELERIIAPLGLHRKRARAFVLLSRDVEAQRAKSTPRGKVTQVSDIHGVGIYAADAHALFIDGVLAGPPRDHALRWYHAWAYERRLHPSSTAAPSTPRTNP